MIKLIVGLGNPGKAYQATRHNAGVWFVHALASYFSVNFNLEPKFQGMISRVQIKDKDQDKDLDFKLLLPMTFMNLSGQSVRAVANFYKILPQEILIIHDEIDLKPGTLKLKFSGGDGGQKGVRSVISDLGTQDFWRLRLGVGHPGINTGYKDLVADYVLHAPSKHEYLDIQEKINSAVSDFKLVLEDKMDLFMNRQH